MPEDDTDLDQYREKVNNTLDDGGGCGEAWEALTELRGPDVDRRGFLASALGAGLGVSGLASISDLVNADVGPFAGVHRTELHDPARANAIRHARDDPKLQELLAELPQGSSADVGEAEAFRITYDDPETAPLTQLLIPTDGLDNPVGYAYRKGEMAAGIQVSSDTWLQVSSSAAAEDHGVERKVSADEQATSETLDRIRGDSGYQELVRELEPTERVATDDAQVTILPDRNTALAFIPVTSEASGSSGEQLSDTFVYARVDTETGDVVQVQQSLTDCYVNCLAGQAEFFGVCFVGCCALCWTGVACICCIACLGFVGSPCILACQT